VVPSRPISSAAAANTPYSSSIVPEIGAPIANSRLNSSQSGLQKRPRMRYFLNGRQA
jgi:hypothetical protein